MTAYVVRAGDNLSSIAKRHGTSVQALVRENRIPDPDKIYAGQQLRIPQRRDGHQTEEQNGRIGGITLKQLQAIMPNLDEATAREHLPYLNKAMAEFGINTRQRAAAWLANIAVETGQLQWLQELDNEEGTYLINQPHYPYYGRGCIHLTWEENYRAAGDFLGLDLVSNPDRAQNLDVAWRIAGYFWCHMSGQGDLNRPADAGDFATTVRGVHGDIIESYHYPRRLEHYEQALAVLPETIEVAVSTDGSPKVVEPATEYKEVTLKVSDDGWLYGANTNPIEWARVPGLTDKELATNNEGWIHFNAISVPNGEMQAESTTGTLEENIRRVTAYNWQLVEANIPYFVWREGVFLNVDGPPAYGIDGPAPDPSGMVAIFCAGVGNVDRRLLGLPVPKHNTWSGYDGGTAAWEHNYWDVSVWFDLDLAEEGDIAFQRWGGSEGAQGHWAYCTGGADDPVIQSYPFSMDATLVEPGMDGNATLRQSHDGGYYEVLIKAKDWMI